MKSENKICLLLALLYSLPFLFFGLLLLLFSLPVHAAESNGWSLSSNAGIYKWEFIEIFEDDQTYMTKASMTLDASDQSYFYAFVRLPSDSYTSGFEWRAVRYKIGQDYDISKDQNSLFFTENPMLYEFSYRFGKESTDTLNDSVVRIGDGEGVSLNFNNRKFHSLAVVPFLPCFESFDALRAFCVSGDSSGLLNGGSIDNPDFEDTAYAFTGFTANNKMTATWTGTTERSYLKDEDVEEYVRVSYGFAAKDAPDSIKQVDNDSKEYSTAAKSLTVNVSDLVPDDDSWFLRYVQVIPCYRQAGLGVWGDFYHGVACKVYFNQDGSIDKIVRDFPQGSGDYSYKHIFSSDKYSNEIPAPELSAISHNGFTLLNNSNNDYYVDIILESNLYGVKMEKNAGTWLPVVDTDWIYNSHYYNFADTSQIAINNDVIYIPNLFSANPESDLVDDFKKWSSEYSSYSSLPSMSFLKRSTAARTRYVDQFLFKDNSKYSDSEQLRFSHMAESVFYVRYYNKSMVYGPWVRYKFRDGYVAQVIDGTLGGAYIDVGQVDTDDSGNVRVDENGSPIVSDNVSGRQDYDTGESDFSDGSFSLDLSDVTKFFDYLKKIFESVTGALSSFGSVVAACFGFLPGELINALIFGICVMMFIGIIKAVKG